MIDAAHGTSANESAAGFTSSSASPYASTSSKDLKHSSVCNRGNINQGEASQHILASTQVAKENVLPTTMSSLEDNKSVLGVKLVWVTASCRRKHIAYNLLDTARRHFIYGTVISKENVAFSQPTTDGYNFASSYVGSSLILSY
jgi:hypothetical protein